MLQYIYRASFTKVPGAYIPAQLNAATDKKSFSAVLYKGNAIQLFEHKRKPIPRDDGGWNLRGLRPPNSRMLYLGQSNWPEGRNNQKAHKYRVTEKASRDLIRASSYHLGTRQGPPFVGLSKIAAWCYYI